MYHHGEGGTAVEKFNGSKYPNCESVATPEKIPRVDALSKNGAETLDLIPGLCTAKKNEGCTRVFFHGCTPIKKLGPKPGLVNSG